MKVTDLFLCIVASECNRLRKRKNVRRGLVSIYRLLIGIGDVVVSVIGEVLCTSPDVLCCVKVILHFFWK